MTAKKYVPEAGEIVWINFTPQAGHEQAGHRPALVFSSEARRRNAVLADQVENLDWLSRGAKPKGRVSPRHLAEVRAKIRALIG